MIYQRTGGACHGFLEKHPGQEAGQQKHCVVASVGGRGNLLGTLVGVALLGTVGTALTYLGINPFWERAIQGAIILAALVSDVAVGRLEHHVRRVGTAAGG